jgi:hypothetical protein
MNIEAAIDPVLFDNGYVRVQNDVYRAQWSNDEVEQFLYINKDLKHGNTLVGRFGVRNDVAEIFSCNAIRTYGGNNFKLFKCGEQVGCTMSFSCYQIDPGHWPIHLSNLSESQIGKLLCDLINDHLVPTIGQITTLEKFLSLLISDNSYCPWVATNGAIRAAQIVALAGQIGLDWDHIRRLFEPRLALIARGIAPGTEMRSSPAVYIDRIRDDWFAGAFRSI